MRIINKRKIWLSIISCLIILLSSLVIILYKNKTRELQIDLLEPNNNNLSMFAIMVGSESSGYESFESNILPQKEDGYIFNPNKSICYDNSGNELNDSINYRNNMIRLKIHNAVGCDLYFEKIEGNWCIQRGITNLKDCLLIMEDYSYNVDLAKEYIAGKETLNPLKTAPTINYIEKTEVVEKDEIISSSSKFTFGTSYTFNRESGKFTIQNYTIDVLSDKYIGYYICGGGTSAVTTCDTMYQVKAYKTGIVNNTLKYFITKAVKHSNVMTDSFDSQIGLYNVNDEDGISYIYRGNVKNNYVSYAGFIWRVVRINGNGSIRMIYAGTSTSATGAATSIGTSSFNSSYRNPIYSGYKFDDSGMKLTKSNELIEYTAIENGIKYFGDGYKCDDITKKCWLTGTLKSGDWKDIYSDVIQKYPYTCFNWRKDYQCEIIYQVAEYVSTSEARAYYIAYENADYETALNNTKDSTIKQVVDSWYESNIKNKTDSSGNLWSAYLSDEVFCNDRQLYDGTGYLNSESTHYNAYNRLWERKAPTLICNQSKDKFSVSNGYLQYPIALITLDEAFLAGGRGGYINSLYYLYTGQRYWTMTPGYYSSTSAQTLSWIVDTTGELHPWKNVGQKFGVRPVINLKSNIKITKGTGTAENPYEITI